PRESFARLRGALEKILDGTLTARDVGMVRLVLAGIERKRGGGQLEPLRARQAADAARPTSSSLVKQLLQELRDRPRDEGLTSLDGVGDGQPANLLEKLLRCLEAPIEDLVQKGVITSSEVIARVLPQITSQVAAASIPDPQLRVLHAAIYAAF